MKIIVLYPKVTKESGEKLAQRLQCDHENPFITNNRDYKNYDLVINLGCNRKFKYNKKINGSAAVGICTDKIKTFDKLKKARIPHLEYVTNNQEVPKTWQTIVGREIVNGQENKGMSYFKKGEKLPDWPLFTKWYDHNFEFRIVVYQGKIIGRYQKVLKNKTWYLIHLYKDGFDAIDEACIKATEAVGIDFCGVDVLAKSQNNFRICELNSGPILSEEILDFFVKEFKND